MKIEIEESEFQRLLNDRSALRMQIERMQADLVEAKQTLAKIHGLTAPPRPAVPSASILLTSTSTDWEGAVTSGLVSVAQ